MRCKVKGKAVSMQTVERIVHAQGTWSGYVQKGTNYVRIVVHSVEQLRETVRILLPTLKGRGRLLFLADS